MSEEEEIEILVGRAKRRLESAHHLFKEGFYEDAVSRAYYSMYYWSEGTPFEEEY